MTCPKCKSDPCNCRAIPAPIVGKPFEDPQLERQFLEIFGEGRPVQPYGTQAVRGVPKA